MADPRPGLFAELKRRNVFRVAAMYAVVGWLLIQIGEATFDALGLPEGSLRLLIIVVAAGFPVALVLGWIFDWTSEGIVRTSDDPRQEVARLRSHRRIDFAIIGVLVLALGMSLFGPEMDTTPTEYGRIRSIAVLPLANLSGDSDQDYFSDGMTDALITNLARMSDLRVIGRTSMMTFKGTDKTIPEIAAQLRVEGVIEGSAIREGDRVRISVQLIDVRSGENVWAESYERAFGSALDLQREIAASVVGLMSLRALGWDDPFATGAPVDPVALESYLRALQARGRWDNQQAIKMFEISIQQEPDFALAHLGLAHELAVHDENLQVDAIPRSLAAASRALELDPTLDTARATRAFASWLVDHDWAAAEAEFRDVIAESNDALAKEYLWTLLLGAGRHEEALEAVEGGIARDPINLAVRSSLITTLLFARRYSEVVATAELFVDLEANPSLATSAYANASNAAFMLGDEERSYRLFVAGLRLARPYFSERQIQAFEAGFARDGLRGASRSFLANNPPLTAPQMATHACRGDDPETALQRLQEASPTDRFMMWIGTWPPLDCVRDDPRFDEILRKINWPGLED